MARVVNNRFSELLAIKERLEGRSISRRQIAEETGISLSSVQNWVHNTTRRFDMEQIIAFCDYFGCELGELLVIEELVGVNEESPKNEKLVA